MSRYIRHLVTFLALAAGASCARYDPWLAIAYPTTELGRIERIVGLYQNLSECRTAARDYLLRYGVEGDEYECGRGCRARGLALTENSLPLHICKETVD